MILDNYKQKYLKYKNKYINLKNLLGGTGANTYRYQRATEVSGGVSFDLTGYQNPVITIPNNGALGDGLSNQCMWISIYTYLATNQYYNGTFAEFRYLVNLPMKCNTEFNIENKHMVNSLNKIIDYFDLDIRIWRVNENKLITTYHFNNGNATTPDRYGIGNSRVVNIMATGSHFELIIGGSIFDPFVEDELLIRNKVSNDPINGDNTSNSVYTYGNKKQVFDEKIEELAKQLRDEELQRDRNAEELWSTQLRMDEQQRAEQQRAEQQKQAQIASDEELARRLSNFLADGST